MKIIKFVDAANLINHRLNVILDTNELYLSLVDGNEAGSWVTVARLTHRADVDDSLRSRLEFKMVIEFRWIVEIRVRQKDPSKMSVPDETETVHSLEVVGELADVGVDIIREDILIDRTPG